MKTKEKTKNYLYSVLLDFLKAIPAGVCIAIGGLAYLSCVNKIVGALFFTIGLFTILTFNFNLFTGKVCYAFENKPKYIFNLFGIWCGNLVGSVCVGLFLRLTRLSSLTEKCLSIANIKLADSLASVFILAVLCNVLIFVAVHVFKNFKGELVRALALFFGVSVFVLCGFEHCVANMFYFTFAGVWSFKTFGYLLIMTLGNICGGILAWAVAKGCAVKLKNENCQTDNETGAKVKPGKLTHETKVEATETNLGENEDATAVAVLTQENDNK